MSGEHTPAGTGESAQAMAGPGSPAGAAPPDPGAARRVRRALLLRWTLLLVAAVAGGACWRAAGDGGSNAGWSFVAGLAVTVAAFEFGAYNVRFTARWYPSLTLAAAIGSYSLTVIALGLVYALAPADTIDPMAFGTAILAGVAIWIGTEIERARVRSERAHRPVTVSGR